MQRDQEHCTHHWVLTENSVRELQGDCRRCGAHKLYPASLEWVPPSHDVEEELDRNRLMLTPDAASLEHSLAY